VLTQIVFFLAVKQTVGLLLKVHQRAHHFILRCTVNLISEACFAHFSSEILRGNSHNVSISVQDYLAENTYLTVAIGYRQRTMTWVE
jgi:hypothetical protein